MEVEAEVEVEVEGGTIVDESIDDEIDVELLLLEILRPNCLLQLLWDW